MKFYRSIGIAVLLALTTGSISVLARDLVSRRVLLEREGGSIEVEAKNANDSQTRDAVREELQQDLQNKIPLSTPALLEHRKDIKYSFEKTKLGGRIKIQTHNPDALAAVQTYLKTQLTTTLNGKAVALTFIKGTSLVAVPVLINNEGPFNFLLDTGASSSILSATIADRLKIPNGRHETLFSAGGYVPVTQRKIDSFQVGQARLTNFEISVTNFPLLRTLNVEGILGADYLRQFKVSIDYDNQVVEIEPCCSDSLTMLAA
jgi:predicted aspartyl protease